MIDDILGSIGDPLLQFKGHDRPGLSFISCTILHKFGRAHRIWNMFAPLKQEGSATYSDS